MEQIRAWAIQDYSFAPHVPRIAMSATWPATIRKSLNALGVVRKRRAAWTRQRRPYELAIASPMPLAIKGPTRERRTAPVHAAHHLLRELIITRPWFVVMSIQIGAEGTFWSRGGGDRQRFV